MCKITNISWHGSTIEAELSPRDIFANHYCNSKLEITFGKLFVQEDYLQTESSKEWIDRYIKNGHEKLLEMVGGKYDNWRFRII